jgi:hypothetical protein
MRFAAAMRGADEDEREIPVVFRLPNDDPRDRGLLVTSLQNRDGMALFGPER